MTRPRPSARRAARRHLEAAAGADTPRSWYRFTNRSPGLTEIYLYDEIGASWWGGVSASDFVNELRAVTTERVALRINSPGGDVWDGLAILNAIRAHPATVTTIVDGIAASAASVIAMGGDEVVMMANSELMIHDASGMAWGNADLMREMAADLDRESNNIANVYARKAGGSTEDWRAAMVAESWYTPEEALAAGLIDRVQEGPAEEEATDSMMAGKGSGMDDDGWWDAFGYRYAGRMKAPAPKTPTKGTTVALADDIRKRLGVRNDADDATILAALDEALAEGDDDETPPEGGDGDGTQVDVSRPPAPATGEDVDDGTVTVSASALAALRQDAVAGREARAQQLAERRQNLVAAAIADGRITPADRDRWQNNLATDPEGYERRLAALEPGLAVPVGERGHDGGAASERPLTSTGAVDLAAVRNSPQYRAWKV